MTSRLEQSVGTEADMIDIYCRRLTMGLVGAEAFDWRSELLGFGSGKERKLDLESYM